MRGFTSPSHADQQGGRILAQILLHGRLGFLEMSWVNMDPQGRGSFAVQEQELG